MIFDELWRAERRVRRRAAALRQKYMPLIAAAGKARDASKINSLESDWYCESLFNQDDDVVRTRCLLQEAKRFDIPIPRKKQVSPQDCDEDPNWDFNEATGDYTLTDNARHALRSEIRKVRNEEFQYKVRWVTQLIIPVGSLLVALAALLYRC